MTIESYIENYANRYSGDLVKFFGEQNIDKVLDENDKLDLNELDYYVVQPFEDYISDQNSFFFIMIWENMQELWDMFCKENSKQEILSVAMDYGGLSDIVNEKYGQKISDQDDDILFALTYLLRDMYVFNDGGWLDKKIDEMLN